MRVFMTGGTGFVETTHATRLIELDYEVTVLIRALSKKPGVMGSVIPSGFAKYVNQR
jgi:nucleoside-diphosphate-sugar epimerase